MKNSDKVILNGLCMLFVLIGTPGLLYFIFYYPIKARENGLFMPHTYAIVAVLLLIVGVIGGIRRSPPQGKGEIANDMETLVISFAKYKRRLIIVKLMFIPLVIVFLFLIARDFLIRKGLAFLKSVGPPILLAIFAILLIFTWGYGIYISILVKKCPNCGIRLHRHSIPSGDGTTVGFLCKECGFTYDSGIGFDGTSG